MNGINLAGFAAVLTAVGGILGGVFLYTRGQVEGQAKIHEGRVADLQKSLDRVEKDAGERTAQLRSDFARQLADVERARERVEEEADERAAELRRDFDRQMTDVKQAMVHQAQTIERQEIMLSDYSRHVGKLERIMAAAQLPIPDFETSPFRGAHHAKA